MRIALFAVLALGWVPGFAGDRDIETEIDFLLSSVGDSGCSFLRNGDMHSSSDAEAHLRMKYRRGKAIAGYNVQTAVDAKHHLIVAHDVNSGGHDRIQLAKQAIGSDTSRWPTAATSTV